MVNVKEKMFEYIRDGNAGKPTTNELYAMCLVKELSELELVDAQAAHRMKRNLLPKNLWCLLDTDYEGESESEHERLGKPTLPCVAIPFTWIMVAVMVLDI